MPKTQIIYYKIVNRNNVWYNIINYYMELLRAHCMCMIHIPHILCEYFRFLI